MNKLDSTLAILGGMTGLTFEDVLKQAEAETPEAQSEALAANVAKMADHMRPKLSEGDCLDILQILKDTEPK